MFLKTTLIFCLITASIAGKAQQKKLSFAVITDTHVGSIKPEDFSMTVASINKNPDIAFVLVTGDLTNHGTKEQLLEAKAMLDKLDKKYYAIAGNHEEVWSPSGGTAFKEIFGADRFAFEHSGYFFIGTDCGPVLRHGLAHVPKDNLLWMDSVMARRANKKAPVIFANHYPMNNWVDNYYEVISRLKKVDTKVILCGHGHSNRKYDFSGIPGIMCRAVLPRKEPVGYNVVTIDNGKIDFAEVDPVLERRKATWASVAMEPLVKEKIVVEWPDLRINSVFPKIKEEWSFEYEKDIAGGFAIDDNRMYTGTFDGKVLVLDRLTGKLVWSKYFGGRIFSTPAITKERVLFSSTDGHVYCISKSGEIEWKFKSKEAVVSSPLVKGNRVFVGFSDGSYRCLDLINGKVIWEFNQLKDGFVQSATLYRDNVYFGAWNSNFYALDQETGKLKWNWVSPKAKIYSPAMVAPIVTNQRVFIVTPDNFITCFDANNGRVIWRSKDPEIPVWFSSGLSSDSSMLFAKTRNNKAVGFSTTGNAMKVVLNTTIPVVNDSSPTSIPERDGLAFFSSNYGVVIAVDVKSGKIAWQHKIGNSAISMIMPIGNRKLLISANDGKIVCLNI